MLELEKPTAMAVEEPPAPLLLKIRNITSVSSRNFDFGSLFLSVIAFTDSSALHYIQYVFEGQED